MNKIIKLFLLVISFTPLVLDKTIFTPENGVFFMRSILLIVGLLFLSGFIFIKDFRNGIIKKLDLIIKNNIFISIGSFLFILIISTIFAVDEFTAFWSNTDRFEGLTGIIYLASFLLFTLLIFKKKDYFSFFKLSLLVSLVLLVKEFSQYIGGISRPDSFIGNPTFLAGYLLFSIFCAVAVFSESKNKFFKYFSVITFILSIIGIFLTQTRGSILGLAIGFIAALIYGAVKGKDVSFLKLNLRKLSIVILFIIFIFGIVFVSTLKNEVWQKVPGLSRVAQISSNDDTTQTRILMYKISTEAVNPKEEGIKKLLIGWGPENFSLAYAKYFNPLQFKYEVGWFDRSHNKLLDVLVMNGILGLLVYLSIWFFFFKFIFKKSDFSLLNIGLLLFGVSLLVHLLFVFDQITTSIPIFIVFAFSIYLMKTDELEIIKLKNNIKYEEKNKLIIIYGIVFLIQSLFISYIYFRNDLPAFIQIKKYSKLRKDSETTKILNNIEGVFDPFTIAQGKIRYDFMGFVSKNYDGKNETIKKLSDISLAKASEYADRMPLDLQFISYLGLTYVNQGIKTNDLENYNKSEEIFKKILILSPNKLDFNYGLALSWYYQNKFNEAFVKFEQIFDSAPSYFLQKEGKGPEKIYSNFIKHFYETKDKANFIKTAKRLKDNNYYESAVLDQIIQIIEKDKIWPNINFTK